MPPAASSLLRAAALVALVLLAGCAGQQAVPRPSPGPEPQRPAELRAGTCWGPEQVGQVRGEELDEWVRRHAGGRADLRAQMADDVAFSRRLDCAEPHAIELYRVVRLPVALDRRVTSYAALLETSTPLYRQVRDAVNERCTAGSAYAAAERAARMEVRLTPSLAEDSGLHLAWDPFPADRWAAGERAFTCTFEQDDPGTLRYADLTTARLPESARVCLDSPRRVVPCRGPHQAEDLGGMVLNAAVEKGQVDARKALRTGAKGRYVALSDAEYARLDEVCAALLDRVSQRKGLVARAYPGSADQWPSRTGAYVATCFALASATTPPPRFSGTVFDRG